MGKTWSYAKGGPVNPPTKKIPAWGQRNQEGLWEMPDGTTYSNPEPYVLKEERYTVGSYPSVNGKVPMGRKYMMYNTPDKQDGWVEMYNDGGPVNTDPLYNQQRADELGYTRDESDHLPSVDHTNGMWLKSKKHPTAFKELMAWTLNADLNKQLEHPVVNPDGYFGNDQLQYNPRQYATGGPIKPPKKTSKEFIKYYDDPKEYEKALTARNDSLMLYLNNFKDEESIKKTVPTYIRTDRKVSDRHIQPIAVYEIDLANNKPTDRYLLSFDKDGKIIPNKASAAAIYERPVVVPKFKQYTQLQPKLPHIEQKDITPDHIPQQPKVYSPKAAAVNTYTSAGYPMVGGKTVPTGRVHDKGWKEQYSSGGHRKTWSIVE